MEDWIWYLIIAVNVIGFDVRRCLHGHRSFILRIWPLNKISKYYDEPYPFNFRSRLPMVTDAMKTEQKIAEQRARRKVTDYIRPIDDELRK